MFVRFVVYTILLYIIVEKCHHLLLVGAFDIGNLSFFLYFLILMFCVFVVS